MKVKLNSLCITNYDSEVVSNVKFLNEIKSDEEIISKVRGISESLESSNGVNDLRLGSAYMIKENDSLIGLVRLLKKENKEKSLDIDMAIHKEYRDKGYGIKTLLELGNYILDNSNLIEKIKLVKCVDSVDLQQQFEYKKHK